MTRKEAGVHVSTTPVDRHRRRLAFGLPAAAAAFSSGASWAQATYPSGPIRLVIPNGPGTASDNYGRLIGNELSKRLSTPVIVDNRAGAEGRIAARYLITTPPDGQTLFLGTTSTHAVNPVMFRNNGYDPLKDMTTIGLLSRNYSALCVGRDSPIRSYQDLIVAARAANGRMNMGGGTSAGAIGTRAFLSQTGLEMLYVPYKGSAAALTELMAGRLDAMLVDLSIGMAQIRAGSIRVLATTGARRLASLHPSIPTLQELGVTGFQMTGWSVLSAPSGLKAAVAERLNAYVREIMAQPEVAQHFTGNGSEILLLPPAEANDFVREEIHRWAKMMAQSGITPE